MSTAPTMLHPGETRYLIIGATSLLGQHVVEQLLLAGQQVHCLVPPGASAPFRVPSVAGQRGSQAALDLLFTGTPNMSGTRSNHPCESPISSTVSPASATSHDDVVVIDCLDLTPTSSPYASDSNAQATQAVIAACSRHGVRKLVTASSAVAIPELPLGTPIFEPNNYDESRVSGWRAKSLAASSQVVLEAKVPATLVLPTTVCAPPGSSSPISRLALEYCRGRIRVGVQGRINMVDVRDVARATIAAVDRGNDGESYVLANECATTRQLFTMLNNLTGMAPVRFFLPTKLSQAAPFFGRHAPTSGISFPQIARNNLFDSSRARRDLGFAPRSTRTILAQALAWLDEQKLIDLSAIRDRCVRPDLSIFE